MLRKFGTEVDQWGTKCSEKHHVEDMAW